MADSEDTDGLSTQNEDFEYVDEMLPVLRVQDLLSVDEMASRDPTYLGVTDTDVLNYAYDFFPMSDKARGISKTWARTIALRRKPVIPSSLKLLVKLQRSLADDPETDVAAYTRILHIQDVQQRLRELEKAAFPYEVEDTPSGRMNRPVPDISLTNLECPCELETLSGDAFRLTGDDKKHFAYLRIPVVGVKETNNPLSTGYLVDASKLRPIGLNDGAIDITTFQESRKPSSWRAQAAATERTRRQRVIDEFTVLQATVVDGEHHNEGYQDIEALKRYLGKTGIAYESLSAKEFRKLTDEWKAKEGHKKVKHSRKIEKLSPIAQQSHLFEAIKHAIEHVRPKTEELLESVLDKIRRRQDGIDASVPGFNSQLPLPLNPQSLVEAIANTDDNDIDTYVEAYRELVKTQERENARLALETAHQALEASTQWGETLELVRNRYDLTMNSVLHTVDAMDAAFPAFSDEKQAKAGDDICGYTGSISVVNTVDITRLEEGASVGTVAVLAAAGTDAADNADGESDATEEGISLSLDGETDGQPEVLGVVIPELRHMARRTGLPLGQSDIDTIVSLIVPYLVGPSRLAMLEDHLPGTSKEHLAALLADPTQAEWFDSPLVKRALLDVAMQFKDYAVQTFSRALATWTVILQEKFADRNLLDYKPPASMALCASMWGFHGPPMTRTKGRGTLMYLLCAMNQSNLIFSDYLMPNAEQRVAAIGELAEQMYPERVAHLHDQFDSLKPVLLAQKEAIKIEQQDLKKFLEGNGTIDNMVAGLLQLPKIMAMGNNTLFGRRHGRGSEACCAQQIGSEFKAHADWASHKPLRGLLSQMKALAKEGRLLSKEAATGLLLVDIGAASSKDKKQRTKVSSTIATCAFIDPSGFVTVDNADNFKDIEYVQTTLAQWMPPGITPVNTIKYIEQSMESIAKASKQPKAYSTWTDALNTASLPELAKLGMQLASVSSRSSKVHDTASVKALHSLRNIAVRERDEQRALDIVRAVVTSWANSAVPASAAALLGQFASVIATPTALNNKISELRERQKAAVLNKLNSKDPEMRKLLTQMNRVGIVNIRSDVTLDPIEAAEFASTASASGDGGDAGQETDTMRAPTDEEEAEQDFAWHGENPDHNPDALDA